MVICGFYRNNCIYGYILSYINNRRIQVPTKFNIFAGGLGVDVRTWFEKKIIQINKYC